MYNLSPSATNQPSALKLHPWWPMPRACGVFTPAEAGELASATHATAAAHAPKTLVLDMFMLISP
ncbi:hypothetical protein GCM10017687_01530 [Streptomyces echinatus]